MSTLPFAQWHGFLSPAELAPEFPRILVSLLLLLQRSLTPRTSRAKPAAAGDSLRVDFARFTQFYGEEYSAAFGALSLQDVQQSIHRSAIVLPGAEFSHMCNAALVIMLTTISLCVACFSVTGRETITLAALQDLFDGRAVAFLCKIVCVLEHGLRFVFAISNDSPAHLLAHTRKYYSTLDGTFFAQLVLCSSNLTMASTRFHAGFGQRSKHQLLLDPLVSETGTPNLLIDRLGYPTVRGRHLDDCCPYARLFVNAGLVLLTALASTAACWICSCTTLDRPFGAKSPMRPSVWMRSWMKRRTLT
jgi:hypothetical protein